jgi:hypothetical protein
MTKLGQKNCEGGIDSLLERLNIKRGEIMGGKTHFYRGKQGDSLLLHSTLPLISSQVVSFQ